MIDFSQSLPELPKGVVAQLNRLRPLYEEWNAAINVISRKDMDAFEERHILHSLAIFKAMQFAPGSRILDVGTGGGFPGIPLAIACPDVEFVLCDSIGKKIKVVRAVVEELQLKNVTVHHGRAEEISGRFDFVVSRAVTRMDRFLPWVINKIDRRSLNPWPNGVLALKGGDLTDEMSEVKNTSEVIPVSQWFDSPFFETKSVVYVKLK
ncbi:MAG: 16S rRNA (guanine(527)-N(7))-methyltransferase RsmG [Crocinitomicaceae bacterium]|jgi:16S rRNA (guanine527-N7)-methyltransferase|nr:16S rRNA (guanine(527)-N(7))-methyltransferase RsmG [Crocinitomicaceae bacterium]